jgi:hypothetical protein
MTDFYNYLYGGVFFMITAAKTKKINMEKINKDIYQTTVRLKELALLKQKFESKGYLERIK